MTGSQVFGMLKQSFSEWSEDKAMRLAAALACYTIISLAPLIVISMKVISILPGVDPGAAVENQLQQLIGGAGAQAIGDMVKNADQSGSGTLATIISLLILLFSASGVFAELQDSMNTIWEVKPRPDLSWWDMIKKRFLSMGMVFSIIFLLLVSMFVTAILGTMVSAVFGGAAEGSGIIAKAISYTVEFIVTVAVVWGLFTLIFKYLPDVKIRWRDVWLGALVTAVLFKFGQYGLAMYFKYGTTTSAYGAAGSLVAVLLWAYYSAAIVFFGAEFTQVYARQMGDRIEPDEDAVPVTKEERAQAGIPRREDLDEAAQGLLPQANRRGGVFAPASAVPSPRVVTITKPTAESQNAYAMAGLGIAAGFVVGAIGMLTGRKYTDSGIRQINLNERLDALEAKYGKGKELERRVREIELTRRLDEIDRHIQEATSKTKRRVEKTQRTANGYQTPRWLQRVNELLEK